MNPGSIYPGSRTDAEHTVASARIALAAASLLAVWLDPADPPHYERLNYALHVIYCSYAVGLAAFTWYRPPGSRVPLVTHIADIAIFSAFQLLTLGPSSPFFVYFIFSLFCAAMRWGWRGTLWTAGVVVGAYVLITVYTARTYNPLPFELNRAIIRIGYLVVSAALLVYLGRYEERLREEIERLARWPSITGAVIDRAMEEILQHATRVMGAERAVILWEAGDEPAVHVAVWPANPVIVTRHAPGEAEDLIPRSLQDATFVCSDRAYTGAPLLVSGRNGARPHHVKLTLSPLVAKLHQATGLASAAFKTEHVSGRVFFGDLGAPGTEIMALTDIVAREIGSSLEQLHMTQQLKDIAASEERIRVARDLHDGVLQSLTGVRLEIRAVASKLDALDEAGRDRLFAIERALAIEQRELRMFIGGLDSSRASAAGGSLAARLDALRERIALEWQTPVTIRITPNARTMAGPVADVVPLMVHEAIVNALKHAEPSRVAVTVESDDGRIRVVVADDGQGFPFRGRYDHAALATMESGPRSLLERVTSLGGRLSIESSETGSRVEMQLTL
jgi:signal transduction histidine kinase